MRFDYMIFFPGRQMGNSLNESVGNYARRAARSREPAALLCTPPNGPAQKIGGLRQTAARRSYGISCFIWKSHK